MSLKEFPTCTFCKPDSTCFRHKDKNAPKEKKKPVPINKVSDKKKGKLSEEKDRKQQLKVFFDYHIENRPHNCINCNAPLIDSLWPNARTIIAHLLEKRTFHSVETHEFNFVYLCAYCHSRFDMQLERSMKEFKIAPLIKERVQLLIPLLTELEKSKISPYLL